MKRLLAVLSCCWVVAVPWSSARAAYPLSLRGGVGSPLSPLKAAANLSVAVGWDTPQESLEKMQQVYEFLVGAVSLSRTLTSNPEAPSEVADYSAKQLALAPGVRFIGLTGLVQPFFALHGGWFPLLAKAKASADVVGSPAAASDTLLFAKLVGFNAEVGVRVAFSARASLGLGAGILLTHPLQNGTAWLNQMQGFATLTINLGTLHK